MTVEVVTSAPTSAFTENVTALSLALLSFLAGALCPAYYAQERFRGFGRAVISQLPYQPPPGKDEQEALREASDE